MKYPIAERFKSIQGEGVHTGVPMAFIRLVGCSVGKTICHACDTEFDAMYPEKGGGVLESSFLSEWADNYRHICITGGEPLMRDLSNLLFYIHEGHDEGFPFFRTVHIETSGTREVPDWLISWKETLEERLWITVSPKPGYNESFIANYADELKVIYGGLGDGPGWMNLKEAIAWADEGLPVYLQPRNFEHTPNMENIRKVLDIVERKPKLRMSVQLHKFLDVR